MMEKEKMYLKTITAKARKFYVGEAALHIAKLLRDNCVSLQTRCLVVQEGYENAYTALAYQYNFERDDSYDAILSDMQLAAQMQFNMLPAFVQELLQREYGDTEKDRTKFCKAALLKTITLIRNDKKAAALEAIKKSTMRKFRFEVFPAT